MNKKLLWIVGAIAVVGALAVGFSLSAGSVAAALDPCVMACNGDLICQLSCV